MAIGFHLDDIEEAYFSDPQKMYELNKQLRDLKKQLKTARAEAIKEVVAQLEAEIESSDKYIREYDDSIEQKAYNKGLRDACRIAKETVGENDDHSTEM